MLPTAMDLPANRRAILAILVDSKGALLGSALTTTQKRLASQMAKDGLCWWAPAAYAPWSRDYQTLRLLKKGFDAFKANVAAH